MKPFFCAILLLAVCLTQAQQTIQLQAAVPSFLRNGDRIELRLSIQNTGKKDQTGQAELQLTDAATGVSIDGWFQNVFPNQYFTAEAQSTAVAAFPIEVPYQFFKQAAWRFIVRTPTDSVVAQGRFPVLPVLQPYLVAQLFSGGGTHQFAPLLQSEGNDIRQHAALTLRLASSPALFAYQALTALPDTAAATLPGLASGVFAAGALLRLHQLNPAAYASLKAPDAASLAQTAHSIGSRLLLQQQSSGAFALYPGGPADEWATWQTALALARLRALSASLPPPVQSALNKALAFSQTKATRLPPICLAYLQSLAGLPQTAPRSQWWRSAAPGGRPRWEAALTAVLLERLGQKEEARKEYRNAVAASSGADTLPSASPAPTEALLLEYALLAEDSAAVQAQSTALLRRWRGAESAGSSLAAGAAFALLLRHPVLAPLPPVSVQAGRLPEKTVGRGYWFDTTFDGALVQPALGNITVKQMGRQPLFTLAAWRYFDEPGLLPDSSLRVVRSWLRVQGSNAAPLTEGLRLPVGTGLEVQVTLEVQKPTDNLLITVGLPAGCTVLEAAGIPESHALTTSNAATGTYRWATGHLAPGRYGFKVRLKTTYAGSFGSGRISVHHTDSASLLADLPGETLWIE